MECKGLTSPFSVPTVGPNALQASWRGPVGHITASSLK